MSTIKNPFTNTLVNSVPILDVKMLDNRVLQVINKAITGNEEMKRSILNNLLKRFAALGYSKDEVLWFSRVFSDIIRKGQVYYSGLNQDNYYKLLQMHDGLVSTINS